MSDAPFHIALIPDGNRRWARENGKLPHEGHLAGAKISGDIFAEALDLGATHVTFWGASVSNLENRSKGEIQVLYTVFEQYFRKLLDRPELSKYNVRVRVLGRWREYFPEGVQKSVEAVLERTKGNTENHLTFLLAYSGKDEMLAAVTSLRRGSTDVLEEELKAALWTRDLPPVDLVIRTGGEPHWSQGFMMWDVAEAQLHFTQTLWPAFTREELRAIVENYRKIERRKGA